MEEKQNKSKDEIVDELLGEPSEVTVQIELPSKSKFYGYKGPIVIKPIRLGDELAVISAKKGIADPINALMTRVVPNIDINDLLLLDKLFILIKLRQISSGDTLKAPVPCKSCNTINDLTVVLSQLPVVPFPDDYTDPMELELPLCKKKVLVRLPKVRDELFIIDQKAVLTHLWRFVSKVDKHTDQTIITKFLDKIKSGDTNVILKHILGTKYGIQTTVAFECDKCQIKNIIALPLTSDFLSET
jgi:mRNA-degrading endonuclease HigB of HigAB toxin-antitoxin module